MFYVFIFGLLIREYLESRIQYKAIPLLVFGILIPFLLGAIGYIPNSLFPQINHAPLGFPVLSISFAIAVFGFDMLDLEPIALERFANELPDPVMILNGNKTIIHYNNSAATLFESEVEPLQNKNFFSLPVSSEKLNKAFDETEKDVFEINFNSNTQPKKFTFSTSKVCHNGKLLGWVVHMKDVTNFENQRRELERQNQQLQRFSDGVVHELCNPLSVASQYTELYFEHQNQGKTTIAPEKAYDQIMNAHTRIEEIIENVSWLSEYGQTITETQPVSIKEASNEVWDSLDKENDAQLNIQTDASIIANKTRLKSAFDNLFKNSLRYASPNPKITVRTVDGNLYIEDNGPGIPKEDIKTVFDYGYTTSEEGTGFGLAIVKIIFESHGWRVNIDESYDDGLRVIVSEITFSK